MNTTIMDDGLDWSDNELEVFLEELETYKEDRKMVFERDPNGLNSKEPGSKLDAEKAPILKGVLQYFPRALVEVAKTSRVGANKYSWKGWESVENGIDRYGDALCRHLIAEEVEGERDGDTGLLHSTQVAWNALARLELLLRKKENDNKK